MRNLFLRLARMPGLGIKLESSHARSTLCAAISLGMGFIAQNRSAAGCDGEKGMKRKGAKTLRERGFGVPFSLWVPFSRLARPFGRSILSNRTKAHLDRPSVALPLGAFASLRFKTFDAGRWTKARVVFREFLAGHGVDRSESSHSLDERSRDGRQRAGAA